MGQTKFLYVILAIIFAGVVMVLIMNVLDQNDDDTVLREVQLELQQIADAAHDHYQKPGLLGGGGKAFDGSGSGSRIRLEELLNSAEQNGKRLETANGIYLLDEISEQSITIIATMKDSRFEEAPEEQAFISARICRDRMVLSQLNEEAPDEEECLTGE
ncbi:MAG: hypothetical protein WD355_07225 [Balneolaceae bacterium]